MAQCVLVALSGVVGAGKSSTAKAIVQSIRAAGVPAEHIRFQEFVELRSRARSDTTTQSSSRAGISATQRRKETRWSGYKRRHLTMRIAAGYVFRTMLFRWRLSRQPTDTVLVFDRYFYDSLVHYDLRGAGFALRLLLKAIPPPTVAALLLIGERTIRERRSAYSSEYATHVVPGYDELPMHVPGLLVERTDDLSALPEVTSRIVQRVLSKMGRRVN